MNKPVPVTKIGNDEDTFPIIENIWDFFSHKGIKTVFISVGTSVTPNVELQFSEMLGCGIHIFDPLDTNIAKWEETKQVLVTRKVTEETSSFAKSASKKWVLPRNIHLYKSMPFFFDGSIRSQSNTLETKSANDCVKDVCTTIKIAEAEAHIDVLKIQMEGNERHILNSILDAGYRPAFILIHWTVLPDENTQSMNSAANLQMLGYALIGKEKNNFLYYFNNNNYYETCSWEVINNSAENTLVNEIVKSVLPMPQQKNEGNS